MGRKCVEGCTCGRHIRSEEDRRRFGDKNRGRVLGPQSEEHKRRLSEAMSVRGQSEEYRQKLSQAHTTHNLSGHQSYQRWWHMMDRCYNEKNPDFKRYGARGIRVCEAWHDLTTFLNWLDENLGPCPEGCSIDRIDNDGDYKPGNIRWATFSVQQGNRRKVRNTS